MKSLVVPVCLLFASAAPSQAAIVITEVMSSSAHPSGGTNNGDWFEITNTGSSAVNVTGWTWDDTGGTVPGAANFGSLTSIAPGQSVVICEEPSGDESIWLSNWGITGVTVVNLGGTVFQGLGAGGDRVNIYDAGGVLVTGVMFGTATSARSFEWDQNGNSLSTSVAGENGAFVASSDGLSAAGVDVGSPGFAVVPEPGTALVSALAALGLLGRRNRG